MKRNLFASVLIAGAALGGAYWLTSTPETPSLLLPTAAAAQESNVQDSATAPAEVIEMTLGSDDAPVTMVEYASFTCPHCANFHSGPLEQIKANYVETGKVKFIYREAYFDRPGLWASMVARCGGPLRYFGVIDMIFDKQSEWARAESAADMVGELRKYGKIAGLDDAQLDQCLQDGAKAQALVDWYTANDAADDITGTPSFIINGEKYSNMNYADFAKVLDEKLAAAE